VSRLRPTIDHASTYDLTPDGLKFAIFYTKVHDRILAPLFTAGQPRRHDNSVTPCAPSSRTSTTGLPPRGCHPQP